MADLFRPRWREGDDPFRRLVVQTTLRFMEIEAAGGIVLVVAAAIALAWANIDFSSYDAFWHAHISIDLSIWSFDQSLQHVVNDVLMVVFFLVVGAEIKREFTHGELRDPRQAALPIVAALGGMIVPAGLYVALNAGGDGSSGWGIPVATDIAFALGVLALVGKGVPVQLKVFLLTLAVADDVGGILIIAIFYSESIRVEWIAGMIGAVGFLLLLKQMGFRHMAIHALGGVFLWLTLWEAGVHATLAGVILGLIVPADALYDDKGITRRFDYLLQRLRYVQEDPDPAVREHDSHEALRNIEHVAKEGLSPLEHLEETMAPISAFVVVPIFALANAGIHITGDSIDAALNSNIAWGIFVGLLLGKFVGIVGASALAIRLGIAFKPQQLNWSHLGGAALLAGIGFTVAIFIANLSFANASEELLEGAKIGIFAASIVAAVLGFAVLRSIKPRF
ncbi:MAG: Na+/H+ antiporter NhaA [Chloroflexi bacterium]|nr:Na+/H+ antiporter NhaA [Chloroflexota bacterium]